MLPTRNPAWQKLSTPFSKHKKHDISDIVFYLAVSKGFKHKNYAANQKSRLAKAVNSIQ